jgi:hypothetical protein
MIAAIAIIIVATHNMKLLSPSLNASYHRIRNGEASPHPIPSGMDERGPDPH